MLGIKKAHNVDGLEFWCNRCDSNLIIGGDSNTGSFFRVFGHVWVPKKVDENHVGEYTSILFAVCKDCLSMKSFGENEV